MQADNSKHLTQLARARHDETLTRANDALASMPAGERVTVALVAARAGVSRSWLYGQQELRDQIEQLNHTRGGSVRVTGQSRASAESNRRRLEIAHERITELKKENRELHESVARLRGQLREAAIRF